MSGAYAADREPPAGSFWRLRKKRYSAAMQGQVSEVVDALHRLAAEAGKTPAQLALAWVLSHSEVTVAISGSDTGEQLDENVGAIGWELDDSMRRELDEISSQLDGSALS